MTEPPARDRDGAGRARSARPRDSLGRPLPRPAAGDALPAADAQDFPDDWVPGPGEAADIGARLLAAGQPFRAHEVFEAAWKSAAGPDRELWRGLAQVAVGITHARRGNSRGAVALLRRGAGQVAAHPFAARGDVDGPFVAAQASALADLIEHDGLAAVTATDLWLKLRP